MEHPVTKKMMEILQDHRDSNQNSVTEILLGGPSLSKIDLHVVSQIKGQILAFNEMLNIKTYLIEAIEDEKNFVSEKTRTSK
jgi:hypothetical protein